MLDRRQFITSSLTIVGAVVAHRTRPDTCTREAAVTMTLQRDDASRTWRVRPASGCKGEGGFLNREGTNVFGVAVRTGIDVTVVELRLRRQGGVVTVHAPR